MYSCCSNITETTGGCPTPSEAETVSANTTWLHCKVVLQTQTNLQWNVNTGLLKRLCNELQGGYTNVVRKCGSCPPWELNWDRRKCSELICKRKPVAAEGAWVVFTQSYWYWDMWFVIINRAQLFLQDHLYVFYCNQKHVAIRRYTSNVFSGHFGT